MAGSLRPGRGNPMKARSMLATALAVAMIASRYGFATAAPQVDSRSTARIDRALQRGRYTSRSERTLPKNFLPAVVAANRLGRYFVVMKASSVAQRIRASNISGAQQRVAKALALQSQEGAIRKAQSMGARIVFRYG